MWFKTMLLLWITARYGAEDTGTTTIVLPTLSENSNINSTEKPQIIVEQTCTTIASGNSDFFFLHSCGNRTDLGNKEEDFVLDISDLSQFLIDLLFVRLEVLYGGLRMVKHNRNMTTLNLATLTNIVLTKGTENAIEIVDNEHLVEIKMPNFKVTMDNESIHNASEHWIIVHGNKHLSNETIIELSKERNGINIDVQRFGECRFTEEIHNVSDLELCTIISTDLTIENVTEYEPGIRPESVEKCIRIRHTQLINLDFLAAVLPNISEYREEVPFIEVDNAALNETIFNATVNGTDNSFGNDTTLNVVSSTLSVIETESSTTQSSTSIAGAARIVRKVRAAEDPSTTSATQATSTVALSNAASADANVTSVTNETVSSSDTTTAATVISAISNADDTSITFSSTGTANETEVSSTTEMTSENNETDTDPEEEPTHETKAEACYQIVNNTKLCISWKDEDKYTKMLSKMYNVSEDEIEVIENYDDDCDFSCTPDDFLNEPRSVCHIVEGVLTFQNFRSIEEFHSNPNLYTMRTIMGQLRIQNNNLRELYIEALRIVNNSASDEEAIVISNNSMLTKISMPNLNRTISNANISVYITRNDFYQIDDELREQLMEITNGSFKYECAFSRPIKELGRYLTGCKRISGNLAIAAEVTNDAPMKEVNYIAGCLFIQKTQLDNLLFLDLNELSGQECNRPSEITYNPKLCIPPELEAKIRIFLPNVLIRDNMPLEHCPKECDAINGAIAEDDCEIINEVDDVGLVFDGSCDAFKRGEKVIEIRARVTFRNCRISSIFTVFPELKKIGSSRGTSLVVEKTTGKFNMDDLTKIAFTGKEGFLKMQIDTDDKMEYIVAIDLELKYGKKSISLKNVLPKPPDVCIFTDTVRTVDPGCVRIVGDFRLDRFTEPIRTNITEIRGCLIMINTQFKNYDFLLKLTRVDPECRWKTRTMYDSSVITEHKCIPSAIRRHLATLLKISNTKMTRENGNECKECNGNHLARIEKSCQVVMGDVILSGETMSKDALESRLNRIKEIYGKLKIIDSEYESLDFKRLTVIDAGYSKEPAFEVFNNPNLHTLSFNKLKKIRGKGKPLILFKGNPQLEITKKMMRILNNATGNQCAKLCKFSQKLPEIATSTSRTEKQVASTEQEEEDEKQESSSTLNIGIGIGVTLILLSAAVCAAYFAWKIVKKRKDKKKSAELDKKKQQDLEAMSNTGTGEGAQQEMGQSSVIKQASSVQNEVVRSAMKEPDQKSISKENASVENGPKSVQSEVKSVQKEAKSLQTKSEHKDSKSDNKDVKSAQEGPEAAEKQKVVEKTNSKLKQQ